MSWVGRELRSNAMPTKGCDTKCVTMTKGVVRERYFSLFLDSKTHIKKRDEFKLTI